MGRPLDPWQRWLVIHGGELLPDGRPRFRTVLILVARQNGKTELLVIMALFWQFVDAIPLVLGTSTKLDYARESWTKSVRLAKACRELDGLHAPGRNWHREANGEQESWTVEGARYKIAASNAEGGRSLTVHRLVLDELRQHHDYSAWDASVNAGNAVRDFQAWAITNQGDDRSVVLNDLRSEALHYIESGEGDPRLGIFEWSAPEGSSPLDLHALAQANPTLGGRIDGQDLLAAAQKAVRLGGSALTGFRTEIMCQRVSLVEPQPITPESWMARLDRASEIAGPVVIAVDVPPERDSASIAVAGRRADGLTHLELARAEPGTEWVVPQVAKMLEEYEVASIQDGKDLRPAIVGDRLALDPLRSDFKAAKIAPVTLGPAEMAAACGALQDAINAGTVRHLGQLVVFDALVGAMKRDVGDGGWAWGKRRSSVDISPLVAVTEAAWACVSQERSPRPFALWG